MEHIKQIQRPDGFIHLTPDEGYLLFDKERRRTYSDAVVAPENISRFEAVPKNK